MNVLYYNGEKQVSDDCRTGTEGDDLASLEKLNTIYETYTERANKARARAGLFDGMMGLGKDPRKDSCHQDFYEALEQWTQEFISEEHSEQENYEAAEKLLMEADRCRGGETYWFCFAAQGLAMKLIPKLTREQRSTLFGLYDQAYPQSDLLPIQKKVYAMLKKNDSEKRLGGWFRKK